MEFNWIIQRLVDLVDWSARYQINIGRFIADSGIWQTNKRRTMFMQSCCRKRPHMFRQGSWLQLHQNIWDRQKIRPSRMVSSAETAQRHVYQIGLLAATWETQPTFTYASTTRKVLRAETYHIFDTRKPDRNFSIHQHMSWDWILATHTHRWCNAQGIIPLSMWTLGWIYERSEIPAYILAKKL